MPPEIRTVQSKSPKNGVIVNPRHICFVVYSRHIGVAVNPRHSAVTVKLISTFPSFSPNKLTILKTSSFLQNGLQIEFHLLDRTMAL